MKQNELLKGITVLDFTRLLPGPVATHLLAQMGADVLKIESPKRTDYLRKGLAEVEGASPMFHQLNHNKKQLSIDYESEQGKIEIYSLMKEADVLIEQFRPGAMDAWELGYNNVKKVNPTIVYASLTGYGQDSVFANQAGHDFNYLGYSGIMSLLKDEHGKPMVSETQFADISGAYTTVMAIQAALLNRFKSKKGCFLDIALCDATSPFLAIPYGIHCSGLDYRQYNIINGKTTVNYACYQCLDGKWLSVAALELKFWNNFCQIIDKPQWKRNSQLELMNFSFPKHEVEDFFLRKTRDEWARLFEGKDVCIAPILEIEELEKQPYHIERGTFEEFVLPNGQQLKTIGLPFKVK